MIAGLALAGGAARRMGGGDKPLLDLMGQPILFHVLERLRQETAAVAISANGDPARFSAFGCPVLPDGDFAGNGPLAGVLAGLEWAADLGVASLLTIPGDTPFAPVGLAASLAPAPAWAVSGGRTHHLVALWPVAIAADLKRFLSGAGPVSVHAFGHRIGMRDIPFPTIPRDPFLNVNTPADLAEARRSDIRWGSVT